MRTHSYSSLKTYKTCPRQYEALYVTKTVKRTSSPALEKGTEVHQHFEDALNRKAPDLPNKWGKWQPLVETLRKGPVEPEVRLAIDREGKPCDFWDKNAMLRGAIDVRLMDGDRVLMLDWKTGKVYPDRAQADVYAMMQWAQTPDVKIKFSFVYLEHNKTVPVDVDKGATRRVQQLIDTVDAATTFSPRPCFACRFCPVMTCEYHD